MRYGDDFIMIEQDFQKLNVFKTRAADFLRNVLKLYLNPKSDSEASLGGKIFKAQHGLRFLGVIIWPHGRKLNKRNMRRVCEKLTPNNIGSYYGLMKHHTNYKKMREFAWFVEEKLLPPR